MHIANRNDSDLISDKDLNNLLELGIDGCSGAFGGQIPIHLRRSLFALVDTRRVIREALYEFDNVYDGPESRVPGSIVEQFTKLRALLPES